MNVQPSALSVTGAAGLAGGAALLTTLALRLGATLPLAHPEDVHRLASALGPARRAAGWSIRPSRRTASPAVAQIRPDVQFVPRGAGNDRCAASPRAGRAADTRLPAPKAGRRTGKRTQRASREPGGGQGEDETLCSKKPQSAQPAGLARYTGAPSAGERRASTDAGPGSRPLAPNEADEGSHKRSFILIKTHQPSFVHPQLLV